MKIALIETQCHFGVLTKVKKGISLHIFSHSGYASFLLSFFCVQNIMRFLKTRKLLKTVIKQSHYYKCARQVFKIIVKTWISEDLLLENRDLNKWMQSSPSLIIQPWNKCNETNSPFTLSNLTDYLVVNKNKSRKYIVRTRMVV